MTSIHEIRQRALTVARALYETPWQQHEQRFRAIKEATEGLDELASSNVAVHALYALADELRAAVEIVQEYEGGQQRLDEKLLELGKSQMNYIVDRDFKKLTKDLDIDPDGREMSDPIG